MSLYLLADVETTGVGASDKVVEVAWMLVDDAFLVVDQDHSLINPERTIPAGASAVHGIVDSDVVGALTIDEYFDRQLEGKLSNLDYTFVAHNSSFDYRFLAPYLKPNTPQICTLRLVRKLYPDMDNHKLGTVVYSLGLKVDKERFHSADGDMAVLLALLGKIYEDHGLELKDLRALSEAPIRNGVMSYGKKHRGKKLADVPTDYMEWMVREASGVKEDLMAEVKEELALRKNSQ